MQIAFTSTAPSAPAILALPIDKDAVGRGQWGGLGEGHRAIADAAAKAARFDGEAGAIVELFVADDGQAKQLLLVGVGSGDEAGWSKAGGALVARLLTSGATELVADLSGADATPQAAARFAAAAAQRAWRYDHYRTKLTDKQKVSLTTLTIAGAPDGTDAAWAMQDAVTGNMLTAVALALGSGVVLGEFVGSPLRYRAGRLGDFFRIEGPPGLRRAVGRVVRLQPAEPQHASATGSHRSLSVALEPVRSDGQDDDESHQGQDDDDGRSDR